MYWNLCFSADAVKLAAAETNQETENNRLIGYRLSNSMQIHSRQRNWDIITNHITIHRLFWTNATYFAIFTALHGMQTRSSDENSVRPSVCQTRALWQNGRKLCLDFYLIWKNSYPSFLIKRMVRGGRPLVPEILGQPARVGAKSPIFDLFSLVALNKFLSVKTVSDRVVRHSLA